MGLIADGSRKGRSKVTNGTALFNGEVDGRTAWARLESIGIRRDPTRSRDVRPLNEILAKLDSEATAAAEGEAAE